MSNERAQSRTPIVLLVPGMAIGSGYYRPVVEEFETRGSTARTLTRRGFEQGQARASRISDWSHQDELDTIEQAVAEARSEMSNRPVVLLGHSLGGLLSAGHQLNSPAPADGVVTVASTVPHHRFYPYLGVDLVLMAGIIVPIATTAFGYLPKPAFGAPGARTLMREWARMILTGRPPYPTDGLISTPTLVISLDGDKFSPAGAVDAFARKLVEQHAVTRWHCTRTSVGLDASIDHVGWVRTPRAIVEQVVSWWGVTESTRPCPPDHTLVIGDVQLVDASEDSKQRPGSTRTHDGAS